MGVHKGKMCMLRIYYHPFSSCCQKALIALYEASAAFEREPIDLGDAESRAKLERVWPLARFPVLTDEAGGATVPEASLIVGYVSNRYPAAAQLIPGELDAALRVHLWDRVFDNYVQTPMQKVVADNFRPEGRRDPEGVEQARALLAKTYALIEDGLEGDAWMAGEHFTLADCAAAPALFYANIVVPFEGHAKLAAYYQRLLARPSFARAVDEARPYRHFFPLPWPDGY